MHIEISGAAEKIISQLVASGQYQTADEAINAIVLQISERASESPIGPGTHESPFAKAERLGLIGAAQGLPPDLSTDCRHMEGFGRV